MTFAVHLTAGHHVLYSRLKWYPMPATTCCISPLSVVTSICVACRFLNTSSAVTTLSCVASHSDVSAEREIPNNRASNLFARCGCGRREAVKEGDSYPKPIVLRDGKSGSVTHSPSVHKYITHIYIQNSLDDFCCHPLVMRLTLPESSFYLVQILNLNVNLVGHDYISSKHWHVPAIIPHSRIRFAADILP
jgi:hypothetical protein